MANYAENNIKDILNKYIQYLDKNEIEYPVSGLDYSSLYPSLIMTYNLSPEYLVTDENYMLELKNKDYDIHNIEFEYNYKDYLSNDKSKIIKAWTIRHDESNKQNSMFGLYPSILRDLFKQRSEMKKELAVYKDKKEHIEKYETDYEDTVEYKECIFKLNYCDTKQKALKVFMNTFYGEMGNKNSPLFQLPLAGGVTSSGQRNLLLIKDYVEPLGHKVYYGDSVIGETPILIKSNNKITVDSLSNIMSAIVSSFVDIIYFFSFVDNKLTFS
jgi:DNA polymerase elongation subunit (family B)